MQGYKNGYFLGSTLFDHVTPSMKNYLEGIFGPMLLVVCARSYDEAAAQTNAHALGNGTAIFTPDGDTAREFAHRTKVCMVGANVPIPMAFHSFGGWKVSLFGDHYMHGLEGERFYTHLRTIASRGRLAFGKGLNMRMPTIR